MKLNFLKSSKNNFLKVCFKATFLFVLILSVITTSLSFVYDSKYKAGNIIFAPAIVYTFAGEGTSSNPYQINNATDLRNLSTNVNNGTTYSGKYFKVTTNINLNNVSFTPIGNASSMCFSGTFDGGNHIIQGLNVNVKTEYAGLFGKLQNATIKNLIVNGYILGTGDCRYAGGISGYNIDSTFEKCSNWCSVENSGEKYTNIYAGGIAGYSSSVSLLKRCNSIFTLCSNQGNIFSNNSKKGGNYYYYAAGISGYNAKEITKCFNSGMITAGNSNCNSNHAYAAGICCSYSNLLYPVKISCCYNTGDISAYATSSFEKVEAYRYTLSGCGQTMKDDGTYDFYFDNAIGEYNSTPLNYTTSRDDKDVLIALNDCLYYSNGVYPRRYLRPHSGSVIEDSTPYTFYYEFFQYKYVKTLYVYASGICINGGCNNTYNTGNINSNGYYKKSWSYYLSVYRKTRKYSCTSNNYTFSFIYPQYYYAPITLYGTSNNSYYDNNQNNIKYYYEVFSDGGVYKYKNINYESSINEIINIVINVKGSNATDYFLINKPENSYELTFRVSDETNGTGGEGSVNLLSEVSMNEKINAGKDYFDYSLISTENIKTTKADIKSVDYFKNNSIWGTNNPAINNGYPYIKELYW